MNNQEVSRRGGFVARSPRHRFAEIFLKYPIEDGFNFRRIHQGYERIGAFDGVTRDPCEFLPKNNISFALQYSRLGPHHARDAMLETNYAFNRMPSEMNDLEGQVQRFFAMANKSILQYNHDYRLGGDWTVNAPAGVVAAIALRTHKRLAYGYVADCGVAVVRKEGTLAFSTLDDGPRLHNTARWKEIGHGESEWRNPLVRSKIRGRYINNNESPYGYANLNGDPRALKFVRGGSIEINETDNVFAYTDGGADVLFNNKQNGQRVLHPVTADLIRRKDMAGLRHYANSKVSNEGTIVYLLGE